MATYKVEFSPKGLKELQGKLKEIAKALKSGDLQQFIANKCTAELNKIASERLTTYDNETIDKSYYVASNQYKIEEDTIIIYNNSKIDISSKNMTPETKAKYPLQLSLAKIVEYGIGYTGANFTPTPSEPLPSGETWEYDVNNHGSKGWYYTNESGEIVWTNGFAGRLIFNELVTQIKQKASKWVEEYLKQRI